MMEERGFEDEDELDEVIEASEIEQMVEDADAPGMTLWKMLQKYAECAIEADGARVPMTLINQFDGGSPGWSQVSLTVESDVHLSLLQYVLDAGKSGIGIELFE